jgi:hypothetical protein
MNNKLAEIQIRSNQLIKIDNKITAPQFLIPSSAHFLLSTNNKLQMNFDSRFVRKPALRTESEVLIKSVVVITIITPRKDKVVHSFNLKE